MAVRVRKYTVQVFDSNGRLVWRGSMPESDLIFDPLEDPATLTFSYGTGPQLVEDADDES